MQFFNYEYIKELIVYCCFGGIVGYNIFWIGYGVVCGVKWIAKKLKKNKEEKTNE